MTLKLSDLPDITFVDKDINKILSDMITDYEKAYFESTGQVKKLYPGDPIRIFLYSQALRELQLRVMIDDAAKQNLLKYARRENLRQLGAFSRTYEFEPQPAKVTMRFILSQARPVNETTPTGTRVSPGSEIYFIVKEDVIVPAGVTQIDALVECIQTGEIGNGFTPGQINILVDPLPWIASVSNIDESQGGTELESEDSFRERIHEAPEGFSVAGPEKAYEYFARKYSPLVQDVRVTSPSDATVDIRILLQNGELPTLAFLDGVSAYLSAKDRRPLTDRVLIDAPNVVNYNIDLTYFIRSEDIDSEDIIQKRVLTAIDDYVLWQRSKIGRDINPDELNFRIRQAGAKRAVITSPVYSAISSNDLAVIGTKTIHYGGIEDE